MYTLLVNNVGFRMTQLPVNSTTHAQAIENAISLIFPRVFLQT